MTTLKQLESALINADAAGDTESAKIIANEIARISGGVQSKEAFSAQQEKPLVSYSPIAESARAFVQGIPFIGASGEEIEAALRTGSISGQQYESLRNQLRAQQEQFQQDVPQVGIPLELGGSILPSMAAVKTVPTLKKMGLLKEVGIGTASGAATGYGKSQDEISPMEDTAWGAAYGLGGTTAVGGGLRLISPRVQPGARELAEQGVEMTPGTAFGGSVQKVEQSLQSVPILGSFITEARERGLESFNRGAYNQVLKTIDPKLSLPDVSTGRNAYGYVSNKINEAYNSVVPKLKFNALDNRFIVSVSAAEKNAQKNLTPEMFKQYQDKVNTLLTDINQNPTGRNLQDIKRQLQRDWMDYKKSQTVNEQRLGNALQELEKTFTSNLVNQNRAKGIGQQYRKIDNAYSKFLRVESAQAKPLDEGSVAKFTPAQLAQSSRQMKRAKKGFAEGTEPMQEYATQGVTALGQKIADSGSPERLMTSGLVSGGIATAGMIEPTAGLTLATLIPSLYSKLATRKLLPAFISKRPKLIEQYGESARSFNPLATPTLLYGTEEQ